MNKLNVYETALKRAERELNAHPDIHEGRAEALRIIREALGMEQDQQQDRQIRKNTHVDHVINRLKSGELESYGNFRYFGGRFYEFEHHIDEEKVRRTIQAYPI